MFQKDLTSQKDQDDTAENLGFRFVAGSENGADPYAENGNEKGDDADGYDGGEDPGLEKGESDADGQRVDTGGDGQ